MTPETQAKGMRKMEATRGTKKIWTVHEVQQQEAAIEQLLTQSASEASICQAMREQFGIGQFRTKGLMDRVRTRWDKEDRQHRQSWKAEQIRSAKRSISRLEVQIAREEQLANQQQRTPRVVGLYNAKARMHELLADLTGTRAPLQVELEIEAHVHVQQATMAVIAGMGAEEMTRLMEEANENRRLAEEYRRQQEGPPQLTPGGDVDGSAE